MAKKSCSNSASQKLATASPATLSSDAHSGSYALLLSSKPFDASIALQDSVGHGNLAEQNRLVGAQHGAERLVDIGDDDAQHIA